MAAAAFSPDGKLFAVGDGSGAVHLLKLNSNIMTTQRCWTDQRAVTAPRSLAGGTNVAAADGGPAVHVLDVTNGKEEVREAPERLEEQPDQRR